MTTGRKLKCDGEQPCAHCAKRSQPCTYDPTIRRRGPGKKPRAGSKSASAASASTSAPSASPSFENQSAGVTASQSQGHLQSYGAGPSGSGGGRGQAEDDDNDYDYDDRVPVSRPRSMIMPISPQVVDMRYAPPGVHGYSQSQVQSQAGPSSEMGTGPYYQSARQGQVQVHEQGQAQGSSSSSSTVVMQGQEAAAPGLNDVRAPVEVPQQVLENTRTEGHQWDGRWTAGRSSTGSSGSGKGRK